MSWQLLTALSVILFSINGLLHRVLMKEESSDAYTQSVAFTGLVGLFALIISMFRGGLHSFFSLDQLMLFIPMVIVGTAGNIYTFKGIKLIGASEYSILLTTSKLWLITGTLLVLREPFSLQKIVGALILLLGVVVAQWQKGKFVLNIGVVYVIMAAFFYATADIFSFLILRNFDANLLIIYFCVFSTIALIIMRPVTLKKLKFYRTPKRASNILIVSVNDTLASLFAFMAYQAGRNALQIGPLMATQTIVTVIFAYIWLNERNNALQKFAGAITVVVGTMLLL